jgi:glucosamine 6-phosphate synthetase-like amidotransferase/phosphosugar isomerase protein
MCGIFGFKLNKPIPLAKVFGLLEKLEVHQYARETNPVGGYGAGMAILNPDGSLLIEKIGKAGDVSPVKKLAKLVKIDEAQVLMGHVRMPSPQFMETARFRETAQPYVAACHKGLTVVSAHNGYIENYETLREKLGKEHVLESETIGLVDSEVIPHCFEETLKANADVDEAIYTLQNTLEGRMAISMLQIGARGVFLHLIHKGRTRGLTVWTNSVGEFVFCSRKEPLESEFSTVLAEGRFKETVSVPWQQEKSIKLSFPLKS